MTVSGNRHRSRILAMQALFAHHMHGGNPDSIFAYTLQEFAIERGVISEGVSQFAFALFRGVLASQEEMRKVIETYAPKWPIPQLPHVDRSILEIGVFELLYSKDVPPVVAINEAIEVAKEFGSENSPKFMNGVLSSIYKQLKPS